MPDLRGGSREWPARAFVATLAVIHTIGAFLPDWLSLHRFDGDQSQHVWWTARFADPSLFPGDFIADFFSLPIFAPVGYQAVMRGAVQLADPQRAAESIPFLLGPLLFWLCWRVGRAAAAGSWVGGVVGALVAVRLLSGLDGGLPRSFAAPVLLLGLLGLLESRAWLLGLAGLASALFYPPAAINLGLASAVVLGPAILRERRLPQGWPALTAFAALAVGVVLFAYATPVPDDVGPKITGADAQSMAEFGHRGRSTLFRQSLVDTYLGSGRGGYGVEKKASLSIAILVLLSVWALPRFMPRTAWALIGTGMFAHAAAWATLFALHLPVKYMRYALPLFVLMWLAALAGKAAEIAVARFPALSRPRWLFVAAAAFLLFDGVYTFRETLDQAERPEYRARTKMLRFVAKLPKDALIAAHPEDANAIPLLAKRSVLASKETALPYYRGYYERVSERLEASLRAHYALDWQTVDTLYERFGVDAIVVHDHRYEPGARKFTEPFASALGEALHAERDAYVLVRPPSERLLYHHGPFWVVRLGPPRPGYPAREGPNPLIESIPAAAGTR
ncbi:MAG: hypothetical protein JRG83_03500 [Deltaproteobacteria bacterium]|nr:hypothetical protein [Deltaproteobacteria bacterium]